MGTGSQKARLGLHQNVDDIFISPNAKLQKCKNKEWLTSMSLFCWYEF